jgi:hypothetical protein
MASDTTGFRSLVQQIQERDRTLEPPVSERERAPMREARDARPPREPRRELPRRTRGRTDGMNQDLSSKKTTETGSSLLDRRWL